MEPQRIFSYKMEDSPSRRPKRSYAEFQASLSKTNRQRIKAFDVDFDEQITRVMVNSTRDLYTLFDRWTRDFVILVNGREVDRKFDFPLFSRYRIQVRSVCRAGGNDDVFPYIA